MKKHEVHIHDTDSEKIKILIKNYNDQDKK